MAFNVPDNITVVSGNGTVTTVKSGPAVVFSVFSYQVSGGTPSYSGVGAISVTNAISGMGGLNSGTVIYRYDFGVQSGYNPGGMPVATPPFTFGPISCPSGIVVVGASGWMTLVAWGQE